MVHVAARVCQSVLGMQLSIVQEPLFVFMRDNCNTTKKTAAETMVQTEQHQAGFICSGQALPSETLRQVRAVGPEHHL